MLALAVLLGGCAGTPPIHRAAERGDMRELDRLLAEGESPDASGEGGRTPLHEAARRGRLAAVDRLAQRGARIDARSTRGRTPLMLAAGSGRSNVAKRLLELGAEPNSADERGSTALMLAAEEGHSEVVKLLLTAGAEGEQALERDGQGIFTRYFLRALEGEADFDGDGWVTASEIGTYVRPNVTSASRRRQTPRFGTLEGSGEIAFSVLPPAQSREGSAR